MARKDKRTGSKLPATSANAGQAGEHLVAADLLRKGYIVTKPLNTNTPHDLHAKVKGRWLTFQVKLGRFNASTGTVSCRQSWKSIASDVLALVHVPTFTIRYVNVEEGTECRFSNFTAESATVKPSNVLPRGKSTTVSSAKVVANSSTLLPITPKAFS